MEPPAAGLGGKCLTISSTSNVVVLGACSGTLQEWNELIWVNGSGVFLGYGFQNVGDGLDLAEDPSTGLPVVVSPGYPEVYPLGNWFVDDLS